jgi:plasmid maintenance system antidote protein VapI
VFFGGKYINVAAIARIQNLDRGHVYRVVTGQHAASIKCATKIAAAIGMGLEEFLLAIEQRKVLAAQHKMEVIKRYKTRIHNEDLRDKKKLLSGIPPLPRLPIFRLPKE